MQTNHLYFGDNLYVLEEFIDDNSVDLIYLDPPFNSKRDYNAIFKDEAGLEPAAQIKAFSDTWRWEHAVDAYQAVIEHGVPGERGGEELDGAHDAVEARQTLAAVPPTMSRRENSSMRQGVSFSTPKRGSPGPSCQISFGS